MSLALSITYLCLINFTYTISKCSTVLIITFLLVLFALAYAAAVLLTLIVPLTRIYASV